MIRPVILSCLLACFSTALAAQPAEIKIGYLRSAEPRTALSLVEVPAQNDGIAGARLAIEDNNTTGRFLNQSFSLEEVKHTEGDDPAAATLALANHGVAFVIADLAPDALLKAADAGRSRGV